MSTWTISRDPFRFTSPLLRALWSEAPTAGNRIEGSQSLALEPNTDVLMSESAYRLRVELPGVAMEDVELTVDDRVLSLVAKRSSAEHGEDEKIISQSLKNADYQKSWRLPVDVNCEAITATTTNGILDIRIERTQKPSPKRISVTQ